MHKCYVCDRDLDLEVDAWCQKEHIDFGIQYRCLWHGVPGITRAIGMGGGFNGYAKTLKQARDRCEHYLFGSSAAYAAPEVQTGEQAVLNEVGRLEKLGVENGTMKEYWFGVVEKE